MMAILLATLVVGAPLWRSPGARAVAAGPLSEITGATATSGDEGGAPPERAELLGGPWLGDASEVQLVPSDVAGTVYAGPVSRLQALGVLTGGADGLFRPGDPITRAEASAVLVRLRGYTAEQVAAAGNAPGRYPDVPLRYWAAGYVNLMDSLGVVRGYDDGTFRPQDLVTRAEFLTMLIRLLGYGELLQGSWPEGAMGEAERLGLITDPAPAPDEPVTRGEVALVVDRAAHRVPVAPALDPAGRTPAQLWLGKADGAEF